MKKSFGISFVSSKSLSSYLKCIYGIGNGRIEFLLTIAGGLKVSLANELTYHQESLLISSLHNDFILETELKRSLKYKYLHLKEINSYRGFRHKLLLPVRGQRTHTNAQTQRRLGKR